MNLIEFTLIHLPLYSNKAAIRTNRIWKHDGWTLPIIYRCSLQDSWTLYEQRPHHFTLPELFSVALNLMRKWI